ncbi:type II toxin-antitoxin system RelE/ParE family toxin [Thauera sp. SDU_THAU2]|uniref:type II toxin-antitoxin system RelE/ParE family toxin n=1 Tax=Thauera sp. SDU_THAU2 TaxID=3136633 RepID=UPI004054C705
MPLQIRISVRAAVRIQRAAAWWADKRPAAPGAIGKDFAEAVALLAEQPGIGAAYEGARARGVRRLYLSRLRYFIYYKADQHSLHVLAFWHSSREYQPRL